jgi:hypothetical protein
MSSYRTRLHSVAPNEHALERVLASREQERELQSIEYARLQARLDRESSPVTERERLRMSGAVNGFEVRASEKWKPSRHVDADRRNSLARQRRSAAAETLHARRMAVFAQLAHAGNASDYD